MSAGLHWFLVATVPVPGVVALVADSPELRRILATDPLGSALVH